MEKAKNPAAVALGRLGGTARLRAMAARQRSESARHAATLRWAKVKRSPMTDIVERMWFAHLLLTGAASPDERAWAIDEAERLLRDLPPSGTRDDALDVVEAARGGDVDARRLLASNLDHLRWLLERARDTPTTATKPRGSHKPSLARLVAKAKQLGVDVTVEPNGTATFRTGTVSAPVDKPQTEVDEWIAKHAH
jgi:hypothetical protein